MLLNSTIPKPAFDRLFDQLLVCVVYSTHPFPLFLTTLGSLHVAQSQSPGTSRVPPIVGDYLKELGREVDSTSCTSDGGIIK